VLDGRGVWCRVQLETILFPFHVVPGLENRDYGRSDPSRWLHGTLYQQKLALTSPTRGGRSVGIVRSRTQATEFVCFCFTSFIPTQPTQHPVQWVTAAIEHSLPTIGYVKETSMYTSTGSRTKAKIFKHGHKFTYSSLFFSYVLGSIVVKALCYKPKGRGFDTPWGDFFLIFLILSAALGTWVYSASNRTEHQKHKNNNVSGE
jgi:hypothetical protein